MKPFKRLHVGWQCAATLGSCDDSPDALATYNSNGQTQDETIELTEGESRVLGIMSHGGTRRSQCEAEDIAVNFTTSPDGDNRALRYVGSCRPLVGQATSHLKTTGGEPREDTLAYVVNFADSMGFAIVSADLRIPDDVLAFVESGELGDTVDNPGLALFLDLAEDYMLSSIEDFEATKDSVRHGLDRKLSAAEEQHGGNRKQAYINPPPTPPAIIVSYKHETSPWETEQMAGPLSAVEWGQRFELFTANGLSCGDEISPATGCAATATAQLMAYWKYGFFTNASKWNNIVKYSASYSWRNQYFDDKWAGELSDAPYDVKKDIASLMQSICSGIGTTYGCKSSSAKLSNAVDYLRNLGYSVEDGKGYSYGECKSSLDRKCIVAIRGCSKKSRHKFIGINIKNTYSGCHAWLIDGYLEKKQETTTYKITEDPGCPETKWFKENLGYVRVEKLGTSITRKKYIHNNWGWSGSGNGFYAEGIFDATKNVDYKSDGEGNKSAEANAKDNYFQYQLTIYPNIRTK